MKDLKIDKIFLFTVLSLLVVGFIVFMSASMGILATDGGQFSSITFKQAFFGILLGLIACFIFTKIDYKFFKKYALLIFIASLVITAIVLIPGVGVKLNNAQRWLVIGGFSFQPVTLLNIGFIIYWAAWLSFIKEKVSTIKYAFVPLIIILAVVGIILMCQPDNDSFFVICITGVLMLLIAGGRIKHILIFGAIGVVCLVVLAFSKPYVMSRIQAYMNPGDNSLTSGYQVQQSLIAIGSGQVFGRGLGQSIQKYKFLPESISDSIFAILGEELGFAGCFIILALFIFFIFRGFRISIRAPDTFGGLLVSGIVILIATQSFVNIASTLAIIPFSGIPLAFFSKGGSAMLVMMAEMGIILNVSKK